jgi:hypothetical protein
MPSLVILPRQNPLHFMSSYYDRSSSSEEKMGIFGGNPIGKNLLIKIIYEYLWYLNMSEGL